MPIIFRCEHCDQKLSIASRKAGDTVNCPACQQPLTVPVAPDEEFSEEALQQESEGTLSDEEPSRESYIPSDTPTEEERKEIEEESISFRKSDSAKDEMDLTPMVDVTFLLLIFFMITASFTIQNKFNWPNPKPDEEGVSSAPDDPKEVEKVAVVVVIDEKNEITVDDEPVGDVSQLREMIEKQMRAERKSQLMLKAHAMSLHEFSIKVVDAAKGAGIQTINYGMTGSLETE